MTPLTILRHLGGVAKVTTADRRTGLDLALVLGIMVRRNDFGIVAVLITLLLLGSLITALSGVDPGPSLFLHAEHLG